MVYKSLTLAPGETYVLPSGATILSVTGGTITSQNDCADLSKLEDLECYCFQIVCTEEAGGTTPVFKEDNIAITGLYLASDNTSYNFTVANPGTIVDIYYNGADAIQSTTTIGPLILDTCTAYDSGALDRGQVVTICFKTLPSIGDYLFLNAQTAALLNPDFTAYFKIPAQKYDNTAGTKCECTVSES
jgi:hypothetical protein